MRVVRHATQRHQPHRRRLRLQDRADYEQARRKRKKTAMPPFPQGVDPRFAWVGSAACTAFELGPPREPDSRVTSRSAFLVAVLRYEGERFGARSGDRFRGFQGCSGLRGDRAASAKTRRIEGKARHQAPSRHPIAGDRSLHGKERVRGSSPREGFASSLLISFFRRLWRRPIRGAASTERSRNGAGGALERPQRSP
jgi:hypothetical protein